MASLCCTSSASALLVQPIQSPFTKAFSSRASLSAPRRIAPVTCSVEDKSRVTRREVLGLGGLLAVGLGGLQATVSPPEADAAQATCGEYNVTPSGLAFCDSQVGTGVAAAKGMLIKAHYSGRLENGNQFDSSYSRGKPLTFRVGVGEVIRGWDQGILGTADIPPCKQVGRGR